LTIFITSATVFAIWALLAFVLGEFGGKEVVISDRGDAPGTRTEI
jgi:hypothetical protein